MIMTDLVIQFLAESIVAQFIQKIPTAIMSTVMQRRRENGGGGSTFLAEVLSTFLAEVFDRDLQERSKDEMVDKSKQPLMILDSVVMAAKGQNVNGPSDLVTQFLAESIVAQFIQKIPTAIMSTVMQRRRENGGGGSTFLAEVFDRDLQERSKDEMVDKSKQLLMILGSVVMAAKGRKVNGPLLEWLGDIVEGMYQGQYMVDIMKHQSNSSTSYEDRRELLDSLNKLEDLNSKIDLFFQILKLYGSLDTCVTNYLNMDDDKLFGRLAEKGKLINFLLGLNDNSGNFGNVDVLTITGAEGVGKSALVEYFYNENWVRNHFSLQVWLGNVSLHEPEHFIKDFFNQVSSNNVATDDDAEQMLTEKTFLLVIDNASDINARVWTVIKACLEYGNKGSKVIITSRMDEATGLGTVEPIILDPMTKGEYCCFLKKIVFGRNRPEGYAKLARIAKDIAYFLNGYPLAAKVMAARLLENVNIQHWENILKSIKTAATTAESRGNSSRSYNPSTETWLRNDLMWKNYENANQADIEANRRATMLENRVIEMQGQMERMTEAMQQLSDHSRPNKRARLISSEPLTLPSSQDPSVFRQLPENDEQMVRIEDAGASCSYQNKDPVVKTESAEMESE